MRLPWPLSSIAQAWASLSLYWRIVLALGAVIVIGELALRRFAPRSRAYALWSAFFHALGTVWTAVILSLIYVVSVGPVSLGMRLLRKDPLDRRLEGEPTFWRAHEANPLGPEAAARHQF